MTDQIDSAVSDILMDRGEVQVAPGVEPVEDLYRPTLIIGLGGTGTLVLKRLKRLIKEKFGDERTELFQLLALDTEFETLNYYQRLDASEFMNLAETTILGNDIVRAMIDPTTAHIYERLRTWWPTQADGTEPFLPGDITSGAKATRCVGRMALWYRGMEVYRAIESKLDNALQILGLRRREISATGNVAKVFIVCSLAGGTGSGMFLDVAYMVRQILDGAAMTSFITGLLLADASLFAKIIQDEGLLHRMEANIYAALCELDWFMGGHRGEGSKSGQYDSLYDLQYLHRLRVQSSAKPFDVCYLVTAINEHSRRLRLLEDLTEMMAQEIFLEIATPLGSLGRSALDNVERLSHFSQHGPRPLAYSSFAVSSLNFNPELVSRQCTLNLARRTSERLIASIVDQLTGLPVQVSDQLRELPLNTDGVASLLIRHMEDNPNSRLPDLMFPSGIEGEQYQIQAMRLRGDLEHTLEDFIRPAFRETEDALAESYRQGLDGIIRTLLSTGEVSLAQIARLAEEWLVQVEVAVEEMEAEEAAAQQEASEANQQVEAALARLRQELATPERLLLLFPSHKQSRVASAAEDFLSILRPWSESLLDSYQWQTLASVFQQVAQHLRWYRDKTRRLRECLETTHRRILERQQAIKNKLKQGSSQYQLEFEVLDAADVDVLTAYLWRHIGPEPTAEAVLDELALLDADSRADRLWGARIIEYLHHRVSNELNTKDLFEILSFIHKDSEAGVGRQMKKLLEYAAPFWHLKLTHCPEAKELSVISLVGYAGVSGATSGNYFEDTLQQVMGRYSTVDIPERNRVVFLNTKHGVPLFALSVTHGMMRRAYYDYRMGWLSNRPGFRPVHISQKWMDQHDLDPTPPPN